MKLKIHKSGNSFSIRLPKAIAMDFVALNEVEADLVNGNLVIKRNSVDVAIDKVIKKNDKLFKLLS